jgi:hypothetical protein
MASLLTTSPIHHSRCRELPRQLPIRRSCCKEQRLLFRIRHNRQVLLIRIRHNQQVLEHSKVLVLVRNRSAREPNSYVEHESLHTDGRKALDGLLRHMLEQVHSKLEPVLVRS